VLSRLTGRATTLRCALPAMLIAVVVFACFRDKAYTIDDTLFLRQAEQLTRDPLHPTAFTLSWRDVPERMSSIMPSGPVMAYLLLPSVRGGAHERSAHLVVCLMMLVAICFTVRLALRLGFSLEDAALAGLVLASTPAVLAMATTVMPDVPAMAFGVLGVERFFAWRSERRRHQAVAAALGLALAALARTHLLVLVGALGLIDRREQKRFLLWAPLGAALLLVWLGVRITHDPIPGALDIAGSARRFMTWRHLDGNLLGFACDWVLAMPLGLGWLVLRGRALPWRLSLLLLPAAALLLFTAEQVEWLWAAPIAALGALVLVDVLLDARRRGDGLQLVLGVWLLLALPVALYVQMAPKYLIASAPAVALLLTRRLANGPRLRVRLAGALVVGGLILGVAIARADERLANLDRRMASEIIPRLQRQGKVWFNGHWGFQWYAEKLGAAPLTRTPPLPEPGDFIVSGALGSSDALRSHPARRQLESHRDDEPGGRIMSRCDGAGFYANSQGYLPWTWGSCELERVEVFQLTASE
jgi:hypothetical protein